MHKQYVIHRMCWELQKKGKEHNSADTTLGRWGGKTSRPHRLLLAREALVIWRK